MDKTFLRVFQLIEFSNQLNEFPNGLEFQGQTFVMITDDITGKVIVDIYIVIQ